MKHRTTSPGSHSDELVYKQETFDIVGAAIHVHRFLGQGFLEPVYQESLELEFEDRNIPHVSQKRLPIYYRGQKLKKYYQPDFLCFGKIVVEIKALNKLTDNELAQTLNYLRITDMKLGILINFGSSGKLEWKRIVL